MMRFWHDLAMGLLLALAFLLLAASFQHHGDQDRRVDALEKRVKQVEWQLECDQEVARKHARAGLLLISNARDLEKRLEKLEEGK